MRDEFCIGCFHGYAEYPHRPGKPETTCRFQALAAAEALRSGTIDVALFTINRLNPGEETIADLMADQTRRNLRIAPDSLRDRQQIWSLPSVLTTREESLAFRSMVDALSQRVDRPIATLHVGKNAHLKRIARSVEGAFRDTDYRRILRTNRQVIEHCARHPKRYRQMLDNFEGLPMEQSFWNREVLINAVDLIPGIGPQCLIGLQKIVGNKDIQNNLLAYL